MSLDHTQQQSPEDHERAKELSRTRARPPLELPGYEVHEFLGAGAYGEVWVGADRNTGRRVAIKFYAHRGGVDWALLQREVEKLVFLSADRYVVQLLEVGWDSDPPWYVMEYVENGSLDDLLRRNGPLPVPQAVEMFREIAVGLSRAHGKGVLHCDLKPANILLDAGLHPRLADFGQARLSHEQRPALGTLFFMAPEQADLQALPDARWDVYALGALLHCLLTGDPPFRNELNVRRLETASALDQRLEQYRQLIRSVPPPQKFRQIAGVDRGLGEIMERCLAVDTERRFPNVQRVLDALAARDAARAKRPLVALGFVGPVLLLIVMVLFGWRGYERAVKNTETLAHQRAFENNRFAAQLAAEKVAGEIANYFEVVREEAERPEFHRLFYSLVENDTLKTIRSSETPEDELAAKQKDFEDLAPRRSLEHYLKDRLQPYLNNMKLDRRAPRFASMFALDKAGTMLAAAFVDQDLVPRTVGRNWAHRAYFHGGLDEVTPFTRPPTDPKHITDTHLSPVFKSTTTKKLKVAISTPVFRDREQGDAEFVGVLVMTVNHGDFEFFRTNVASETDRFPILVDGRPGSDAGTLLLHPLFGQFLARGDAIPEELQALRVPPDVLRRELAADSREFFEDPLSRHPQGQAYAKRWIASAARVELLTGENAGNDQSGLIVMVQEDFDAVTAPVRLLGNELLREGLGALSLVVAVAVAMWYFVSRFLLPTTK